MSRPAGLPVLIPGDVMLYRPKGIVGWLIASRTFSNWAHVEVYIGGGESLASRDGIGVGRYPVRWEQLGKVLRPRGHFHRRRALWWFNKHAKGQGYDYLAIVRFLLPHCIKRDLDRERQICSAFVVRLLRRAGVQFVAKDVDADMVAPSTLAVVPDPPAEVIWTDGK